MLERLFEMLMKLLTYEKPKPERVTPMQKAQEDLLEAQLMLLEKNKELEAIQCSVAAYEKRVARLQAYLNVTPVVNVFAKQRGQ